jgi:hypothetical protein
MGLGLFLRERELREFRIELIETQGRAWTLERAVSQRKSFFAFSTSFFPCGAL